MNLFDQDWYLDAYPDVHNSNMSPLEHFVRYGDKEGRSPHPLFDTQWYLDTYPDVSAAGGSPLLHYVEKGVIEGRDPCPYFSTLFYAKNNPSSARNGNNPLAHFIAQWDGGRDVQLRERLEERVDDRRCDPHPLFDMRWYLARYSAEIPANSNPLVFHIVDGSKRDFDPHPLIDSSWYRRAYPERNIDTCVLQDYLSAPASEVRSPSPLFDRQWYIDTYRDMIQTIVDPLIDYVTIGRSVDRLPHPLFAASWYEKKHMKAASYPGGPLCHFREIGNQRGLDPHPLFSTPYYIELYPEAAEEPCGPVAHYLLADRADFLQPHPLFDPRWYVACNPDSEKLPIAPLAHFLGYGIWHNRDPHPLFDTAWYLEKYPQSRQSFSHPLVHYLEHGSALDYWPNSFFDADYYVRNYPECAGMDPLVHFAIIGMEQGNSPNADAKGRLRSVPGPDVYNSNGSRFSNYVSAIGLITRLVLACDAVKKDPVAYDYYLRCLMSNVQHSLIPKNKNEQPLISVILPTYNGLHFTIASIESIGRFRPDVSFEVIIADNVSTDDTEKVLKRRKDIRYIRHPENLGFLRSCNRAARFARGEFIFLLNNDTLVAPGWLDELYAIFCRHENVGLVGSKLIYPDGRLQEAGGIIWQDGSAWNYGKFQDPGHPEFGYVREIDYCSGAAIMLPKRLWDELSGFDEMYCPSYCEDSDLALRVRSLGYSVLYAPLSVVAHFEGMTQGRDTSAGIKAFQVSNTEKLVDRWRPMLSNYQPNGQQLNLAKDRGYTKRVLFLDECTPTPKEDAGSVTSINLIRLFQSRGYLVTFIPRSNYLYLNEHTQNLQRDGIEVVYGHYTNSVTNHLEQHGDRYDVVFMMRPQSFENHIDAVRQYAAQAKLIYHTCDLHYLRFAREAELTGKSEMLQMSEEFKIIEHRAINAADVSIVHSSLEAEILKTELPHIRNVRVFGWAIPVPGSKIPFNGRKGAVFVGGFHHGPNVDAVLFFVKKVLPIVWKTNPDFVFHVVGSKTPKEILSLASKRVVIHGFVENIEPIFDAVQMAVAPLRFGAGIKGKIATAMSVGLPNVVTSIGAEGMDLTDGQNCLIANYPEEIAAAVCKLAEDKSLWNRISQASVAYSEETYGTTPAERIFDDILKTAGAKSEQRCKPRFLSPTGGSEESMWPPAIAPLSVFRNLAEWKNWLKSPKCKTALTRDRYARIRMHDKPELGYPAYSVASGHLETMIVGQVPIEDAKDGFREELTCPKSNMRNMDRLLAALAKQADIGSRSVALYSRSDALRAWITANHKMVPRGTRSDIVITDDHNIDAGRLVGEDGLLICVVPTVEIGLDYASKKIDSGWSDATVEIYHSPYNGHLGSDLIVVRALN